MPSRGQGRVPGLGGATAFGQARLPQFQCVGVTEKAVFESVNRRRALLQSIAMKFSQRGQLHMVETHVGPEPVIRIGRRALPAFRCSRCRKGVLRRKMCLTKKCSRISNSGKGCSHTLLPNCGIEIDSVIPDAMGQRQLPRQYRSARRLTNDTGGNAVRKTRTAASQCIQVRRTQQRILVADAICSLLIGRDE